MPSNILGDALRRSGANSMLRNGLYNVGGQTIRVVVALVTLLFLIRLLGLREYGVWSLAFAVVTLMTVGNGGLGMAAAVFLSEDVARRDRNEASGTLTFVLVGAALLGSALGLLLWFASPLIVKPLAAFGSAERMQVGSASQIGGLAIPLLILQRPLFGIEQAFDRYAIVNAFEISHSLLVNLGLVAVAWLGGRAVGLMKWEVFANGVLLAAHCWFVSGLLLRQRLSFQWNGSKAKRILRFSLARWVSNLGSDFLSQGSRWIVGAVLGASGVGVYSAITNMTSRINSFSGAAVQPLAPGLSRDLATGNPVEDHVRQAAHLNAVIAIEAGIFLYVLADWVMRIMVPGATRPQDILALQIAAFVCALYSLDAPGYFILFSTGGARTNAIVAISSSVVSLGLISLGAWQFGLLGAITGNAGNLGMLLMVSLGVRQVRIRLHRYIAWIGAPLLALAAALVVGAVLEGHLWWRIAFVAIQAGLVTLWFLHEESGVARLKFGWLNFAQNWNTGRE
jgi:O-antigen/teichoic acid export membrane protein